MLAPTRRIASAALLAAVASCGCGGSDGVAVHVDPPHWPRDLPDAVDRLLDGQEAARAALADGRLDEARGNLLPVLRDLAVWLPEVAADSDMPEGPWNRIHDLSDRLVRLYEPILADLDAGRPVAAERLDAAGPLLDELRRERDDADPSWFLPVPVGGEGDPATEAGEPPDAEDAAGPVDEKVGDRPPGGPPDDS